MAKMDVGRSLVGPLQVLNGLGEADLDSLACLILKGWNPFGRGSPPVTEWRTLLAKPPPIEVALRGETDEPVAEGRDQGSRSAEAAVDTEWFHKQKEEVDGFMEWIRRERDLRGVALASSFVFRQVSCGSRNRIPWASVPLTHSPLLSSAHSRGLCGGA